MPALPRELLGRTIGGYQLDALIGMGGSGAVFLGHDEQNQQMAVKILIPPLLVSDQMLDEFHHRFEREAQILSRLDHPHILPIIAFGDDTSSGFPYMILPYKRGGTLQRLIAQGPLPFEQVLHYAEQIADALDVAHAQNIIHRDIKPANVLLDEHDQVALADFSVAKLFDLTTTTLTTAQHMLGTPAYMAPEQVANDEVGPATDVYGLGVLTYQMVTGRLPFDTSALLLMIQHIMQDAPPSPRDLCHTLPQAAADVLLKALAKKPADRFQSAGALVQELERGLQDVITTGISRRGQPSHMADEAEIPTVLTAGTTAKTGAVTPVVVPFEQDDAAVAIAPAQSSIEPEQDRLLKRGDQVTPPSEQHIGDISTSPVPSAPATPTLSWQSLVEVPDALFAPQSSRTVYGQAALITPIVKRPRQPAERHWKVWQSPLLQAIVLFMLSGVLLTAAYVRYMGGVLIPISPATAFTTSATVTVTLDRQALQDTFTVNAVTGTPADGQVQARKLSATTTSQGAPPDAQKVLGDQLQAGEQWASQPHCQPKDTTDHATYTCTGEVYDQKGALTAAKQLLKQQAAANPGSGYALQGDVTVALQSAQGPDAKGTVAVVIKASGTWLYRFGQQQQRELASHLSGKKTSVVQSMLQKQKGIKKFSIVLTGKNFSTFPNDASKIRFTVQSS